MFRKLVYAILLLWGCVDAGEPPREGPAPGDWTYTYKVKTGDIIRHTPNCVQIGLLASSKGIHIDVKSWNGIVLKRPLKLEVESTQDTFEKALRKSGLLD